MVSALSLWDSPWNPLTRSNPLKDLQMASRATGLLIFGCVTGLPSTKSVSVSGDVSGEIIGCFNSCKHARVSGESVMVGSTWCRWAIETWRNSVLFILHSFMAFLSLPTICSLYLLIMDFMRSVWFINSTVWVIKWFSIFKLLRSDERTLFI